MADKDDELDLADDEPTLELGDDDLALDDDATMDLSDDNDEMELSDDEVGAADYQDEDEEEADEFAGGGVIDEGPAIGAFSVMLIVSFIFYAVALALILLELPQYCAPGALPW